MTSSFRLSSVTWFWSYFENVLGLHNFCVLGLKGLRLTKRLFLKGDKLQNSRNWDPNWASIKGSIDFEVATQFERKSFAEMTLHFWLFFEAYFIINPTLIVEQHSSLKINCTFSTERRTTPVGMKFMYI